MIRRVLAGVIAAAVGAPVFIFIDTQFGTLLGCAVVLGVYGLIDSLGLLPSPFPTEDRSLLHAADDLHQK